MRCVCVWAFSPSRSWLVYGDPGFGGLLAVLEVGEYPCPETWGFPQPFIGSLKPLKMVSLWHPYLFSENHFPHIASTVLSL